MGIIEILSLAIALSMDAFAVALCKGLATTELKMKHMVITGLWFGGFQALMPTIGALIGITFKKYIENYDHWVSFILLGLIGINMIKESFSKDEDVSDASFSVKTMFVMAIATSIDALIAGIPLGGTPPQLILMAVILIGAITFILSAVGVKVGHTIGVKYKSKAEFAGGVILILLGVESVLENYGVFNFTK